MCLSFCDGKQGLPRAPNTLHFDIISFPKYASLASLVAKLPTLHKVLSFG